MTGTALKGADAFADECHYFALALQAQVGGELAYVANVGRDGRLAVGHVVVTLADGVHADADGIHAEEDVLKAWDASTVAPTTPDAIRRDLGGRLSRHARGRIQAASLAIDSDPAYREAIREARDAARAAPAP